MERAQDKRSKYTLTKDELEAIAERGAQLAFKKMTTEVFVYVGKGLLERALWILGLISVAAYFWLKEKGLIR